MAKRFQDTALTLLLIVSASAAQAQDRHVIIGLDVSDSTPLISDKAYAARAVSAVSDMLSGLEAGDQVLIQTIGNYGMAENPLNFEWTVSRRTPAIKLRRIVTSLIARLPKLVESGKLEAANSTNLVGFLEMASYSVDCETETTSFVLLTDGIEWSSRTNGRALAAGNASLPAPPEDSLKGCDLTMIGIGQTVKGADPAVTANLIKAWKTWSVTAGCTFRPIPMF